jgi:FtsP/CotA-like multicopper oxidase with cupredoxin domain
MGLYGNIIVAPSEPDYWPPAHREVALTLDDVLIEDGHIAAFSRAETTHTAMGRFGNLMLARGEADLALAAELGEVVRLYLTNTANTRVFNIGVSGAPMKLLGGDSGRCEHEAFVESVILAPSERAVVDVLFDTAGEVVLEHHTPDTTYPMATIIVTDTRVDDPAPALAFDNLRTNPEMAHERKRVAPQLDAEPGKTLAFVAEMDFDTPEGTVAYTCPMHPEVVREEPGRCPECGMKLMPTAAPTRYVCPMHPEIVSDEQGRCPECGMKLMPAALVGGASEHHDNGGHDQDHHHSDTPEGAGGIEWEDDMVEVNRMTTPANMRWKLIDRSSGAENAGIDWHFTVGDQIKIRLVNEMDSDHPMHHPFHIHGAGRFLVLARDGVVEPNLMWKDTVLVRTGEVVDILLDVTNPGIWMAHCHIAEHHESGMMFSFDVQPREGD